MFSKHGCGALLLPNRCKIAPPEFKLQMPNKGIVLFQRGYGAPTFKGCWGGPGGIRNPGETPHQAAIRECWEETRIVFEPDDEPFFDGEGDDRHLSYYTGDWSVDERIVIDPKEVVGYGCFEYPHALALPLSFKYRDAIAMLAEF